MIAAGLIRVGDNDNNQDQDEKKFVSTVIKNKKKK